MEELQMELTASFHVEQECIGDVYMHFGSFPWWSHQQFTYICVCKTYVNWYSRFQWLTDICLCHGLHQLSNNRTLMYSHIQDSVYGVELPLFAIIFSLSLTFTHILFMSYM